VRGVVQGAMTTSGGHLRAGVEVGRADFPLRQRDDATHHLRPRDALAGQVSLRGTRVVESQLASKLGDAPPPLTPELVKGHKARLASLARPVKANLASDGYRSLGQGGHMYTRLAEVMEARGIIYLTPDNSSGSYLLMQRAIPPQPRGGCYAG